MTGTWLSSVVSCGKQMYCTDKQDASLWCSCREARGSVSHSKILLIYYLNLEILRIQSADILVIQQTKSSGQLRVCISSQLTAIWCQAAQAEQQEPKCHVWNNNSAPQHDSQSVSQSGDVKHHTLHLFVHVEVLKSCDVADEVDVSWRLRE